jgi:hypothetical protein
MTPRERLVSEVRHIMHKIGRDELTDQELADMLAVVRPARERLTPANVIDDASSQRNRRASARV